MKNKGKANKETKRHQTYLINEKNLRRIVIPRYHTYMATPKTTRESVICLCFDTQILKFVYCDTK